MPQVILPPEVIFIIQTLEDSGYQAYVVGGAPRDLLMGRPVTDWDFTTNATPEEIQHLFPESYYDNAFGTVGIAGRRVREMMMPKLKTQNSKLKKEEDREGSVRSSEISGQNSDRDREGGSKDVYELTTFRQDLGYSDNRRPDKVEWGTTLEEDLQRRDFTINAIGLKIRNPKSKIQNYGETEVEIIDPYEGQKDLEVKQIRAVGDPHARFKEDALRMIRAIRFGAQLGFLIEPQTLSAIKDQAQLLSHISWERIRDEFLKILASNYAADGILLLHSSGLLPYIVPEMLDTIDVKQGGRHKFDVWNHSLESLRACASTDPIVRLATWLHDIGKPKTQQFQGPRGVTFYGHEVVGAHMAKAVAKRLRLPNKDISRIYTLVRWHMFTYSPEMTDAAIRRFIRRVGLENINDMMLLRVGDRKGGGSKATSWRLRELQRRIGENLYEPMSLKDLKINGDDLMKELKLKPGRHIGEMLKQLFEEVIEDPERNTSEYLIERARELGDGN